MNSILGYTANLGPLLVKNKHKSNPLNGGPTILNLLA